MPRESIAPPTLQEAARPHLREGPTLVGSGDGSAIELTTFCLIPAEYSKQPGMNFIGNSSRIHREFIAVSQSYTRTVTGKRNYQDYQEVGLELSDRTAMRRSPSYREDIAWKRDFRRAERRAE
jgi:hypothetical protein